MLKEIKPLDVNAGDVVGKLSEDELRIFRRATVKIKATKSTIEHLNDVISQQYTVLSEVWDNYQVTDSGKDMLLKRGLTIAIDNRNGNVIITKIDDGELRKALSSMLIG